ncbi:Pr6Pr family membrane protein [Flavobacterium sp.]|uniref:Pr6Pr family membrane protein n=1 Tax=Flavobacterium sp. TaxID=239 RepID=UPI003C51E988
MEKKVASGQQLILITGTILGWFAVGLQLYLIILNRVASIPETLIRFFSFYTILSNILVAFSFSFLWFKSNSKLSSFFTNRKILTAITVYITIVGLVYNTILRFLWNPIGLQYLVDELLHTLIPILFIIHWLVYVDKKQLVYKDVIIWQVFPLVYLTFILIRGSISNYYPYPFLDVNTIGYNKVFINTIVLCLVFIFISVFFVWISKITTQKIKKD